MPLPMVHLAVAVKLADNHDQFPSSAFLLGSIAPDAIHMRENAPAGSKKVSHLMPDDDLDHANIRAMLTNYLSQPMPLPAFALGYAAHLLTDRLWNALLDVALWNTVLRDMDLDAQRKLYYTETDQLDFNLYHREAWRPAVWSALQTAPSVDFPPWLNAAEIDGWNTRTLHWFEDGTKEPHITPTYITDDWLHNFIAQSTTDIETYFAAWNIPFDLMN